MVNGFTKFKERFQGVENQYVIIGGTACDLIMENEELPFRATKDVDIVLIVESITADGAKGIHRGLQQNIGEIDDNALDSRRNPHLKDLQQVLPFYSQL